MPTHKKTSRIGPRAEIEEQVLQKIARDKMAFKETSSAQWETWRPAPKWGRFEGEASSFRSLALPVSKLLGIPVRG